MKNENMKKSKLRIILIFVAAIVLILGIGGYFLFFRTQASATGNVIQNPVDKLSDAQAVQQFDAHFVAYLLDSIGVGNLHNAPFSSDTPKINMKIGDVFYAAEIQNGAMSIGTGSLQNPDIIIVTTKEEAVKMIRDKNYVKQSFIDGKSRIDVVASKTTLFSKGYLSIYNQFA